MRIAQRMQDRSRNMNAACGTYAVMMYGVAFCVWGAERHRDSAFVERFCGFVKRKLTNVWHYSIIYLINSMRI